MMERSVGVEPTTIGLKGRCSTAELRASEALATEVFGSGAPGMESNLRPAAYEAAALPLSYGGKSCRPLLFDCRA